jgi:hypothetical protein
LPPKIWILGVEIRKRKQSDRDDQPTIGSRTTNNIHRKLFIEKLVLEKNISRQKNIRSTIANSYVCASKVSRVLESGGQRKLGLGQREKVSMVW